MEGWNRLTTIIKKYSSREAYQADAIVMTGRGFMALHYDTNPINVTWTNTPPQPDPLRPLTETVYVKERAKRDGVEII